MRVKELIEQLQKGDQEQLVYLNTGTNEGSAESCKGVAIDSDGDVVVVGFDMVSFYCGGCRMVGHFHRLRVEGG